MHAFIVHSGLTLQACRAVIRHLDLAEDEVVVIAGRGFGTRLMDEFREVWDLDLMAYPKVDIFKATLTIWSQVRRFDDHFKQLLGGREYHFYTVHLMGYFYQLLASHPSCTGFSFIEDGLLSYRSRANVRRSIGVPQLGWGRFRRYLLQDRLALDWPYDVRAHAAYGFSDHSYADWKLNRVVLEPRWPRIDLSGSLPKGSVVCILAPAYSSSKVRWSPEQYFAVMSDLSHLLRGLRVPIYLKYHPDQKPDERMLIRTIFRNTIGSVEEIGDDVQVESLCVDGDVTVLSCGSSVGLYAALWGRRVYSYMSLFNRVAPAVVADWEKVRSSMTVVMRELNVDELRADLMR